MTPGHVPWPSLRPEQTVWSSLFQFHGLCLCASPVVSQRSTSGMQTLLSTRTLQQRLTKDSCHLQCCARAVQRGDSVFLAGRSCVTGFPNQLEWETSHTVADRTLTILVSRAPDTTSMCAHSENQPRNRDQSHVHEQTIFLHGFRDTAVASLVTMALRFGHKSSGSSSFREVSTVLVFTVSRASKP